MAGNTSYQRAISICFICFLHFAVFISSGDVSQSGYDIGEFPGKMEVQRRGIPPLPQSGVKPSKQPAVVPRLAGRHHHLRVSRDIQLWDS